jgi:carboxypeptidase C (cathepsin A)
MWKQYARAVTERRRSPGAGSSRYLIARFLIALCLTELAMPGVPMTPALAQQQGRAAPQQGADAPRGETTPPGDAGARQGRAANDNAPRLPADSITEHSVDLPATADLAARTLVFKATAGSIPLNDAENNNLQAEIAFVSYVTGDAGRPVTFLFNGGPGAASAYLDIGAVGPWRVPLDNITPSSVPAVLPNSETWLDFTDLVFIDPVSTGYSHIVAGGDNLRRQLLSVDGDADALAVVIRKWIERNGRQSSGKFVVGESYGGFRVPKVARGLVGQGVGVRGMVMISPVLDFASFGQRRHDPMHFVTHLPSMAATVMEAPAPFDRNALRDVEAYAAGDYLRDLMRGERDAEAIARMTPRVAAYTGLDPPEVKRLAARIDTRTFQRELKRERGVVASAYDPTVMAWDPAPHASQSFFSDPVLDAIGPPLTGAMTALYQGPLKWRVDQPYRLLNEEVESQWNWGHGRSGPEVVDDLRDAIAADRDLQALVAHGASDLVTPYFGSKLILDQMPVFGSADRLKLAVYGGGHMFYTKDASRRTFRADVQKLYRAALQRD